MWNFCATDEYLPCYCHLFLGTWWIDRLPTQRIYPSISGWVVRGKILVPSCSFSQSTPLKSFRCRSFFSSELTACWRHTTSERRYDVVSTFIRRRSYVVCRLELISVGLETMKATEREISCFYFIFLRFVMRCSSPLLPQKGETFKCLKKLH